MDLHLDTFDKSLLIIRFECYAEEVIVVDLEKFLEKMVQKWSTVHRTDLSGSMHFAELVFEGNIKIQPGEILTYRIQLE